MADSNFHVRLCLRNDLSQLLAFSRRLRDKNIKFLSLEEKYYLRRYSTKKKKELSLFLLKHENKIIGCVGHVFLKGFFKDRYIDVLSCSDLAIDPDYSKRIPALFTLLYTSYEEFIFQDKLFLGFPANKFISSKYNLIGWDEFTVFYELKHFFFSRISRRLKPSLKLRVITRFNPEMESFFKKVAGKHNVFIYPGADLFNQRYFSNLSSNYLVLAGYKNNKIVGYVAAEKTGLNIYIDGLTVDLDHRGSILFLLSEVFKRFKGNENTSLTCFLSHIEYITILRKFGFSFVRKKPCLYLKRFSKNKLFFPCGSLCHLDGFKEEVL